MPTIDLTSINVGGPCKITDNAIVFYFEGGVVIEPQAQLRGIPSALAGEDDDVLVDLFYKIRGQPKAIWTSNSRSILLPSALHSFSAAGARLIGAANRALTVNGSDANGFTFTRAQLTKMPDLNLGVGMSLYGEAEWTAFIGHGKSLVDADAFYALNTTAWSQADYPTTHLEEVFTAAWGAVTGFTAMFAETGFKLTHELKLDPVKQGNVTVDYRVNGYRGMVSFNPQQPTTAQLKSALALDNTAGGIGARRSANAADLVITGASGSVTLKGCAPRTGKFVFDNKENRHGEFAFVNALTTPGTRLSFT